MKRLFFIFSLLLLTSPLLAYDVLVKNESSSDMEVRLSYHGAGWCSPDSRKIPKGGRHNFQTGWCCVDQIKARGAEGKYKDVEKKQTLGLCNHIITITNETGDALFKINDVNKW